MNEVDKLRCVLDDLIADHHIQLDQINALGPEKFSELNKIFKERTGNSISQLFQLIESRKLSDDGLIFDDQMSECWKDKYAQCNQVFSAFEIKCELHDFYSINEICIHSFTEIPASIKAKILIELNLPDFLSILIIHVDENGFPTGKFEYIL